MVAYDGTFNTDPEDAFGIMDGPASSPGYYHKKLYKLLEVSKPSDLKLMLNDIDNIKEEMERQLLLKS
jgi:hypothetical protein